MSDLEDILSVLYRMEESAKKSIEFVKKMRKLFGKWDAANDCGAELASTNLNDLIDIINENLLGD